MPKLHVDNFDMSRVEGPDKADPRAVGEGWCIGEHTAGPWQMNQWACWRKCTVCALRMAYAPRKDAPNATGKHRQKLVPQEVMAAMAMVDAEGKPRNAHSFEECLRRVQAGGDNDAKTVSGRSGDNTVSGRSGEDDDAGNNNDAAGSKDKHTNLAKDGLAGRKGDDAGNKNDDDARRKGNDAGGKNDGNAQCKGNDAGDKNNNSGAKASEPVVKAKEDLGIINIHGQVVNVTVTRYS